MLRPGAGGQLWVRPHDDLMAAALRRSVPVVRRRRLLHGLLAAGWAQAPHTPQQAMALAVWSLDVGVAIDAGVALRCARAALEAHDATLALRLSSAVHGSAHQSDAAVVRSAALRALGLFDHATKTMADARSSHWESMTDVQRGRWAVENADLALFTSAEAVAAAVRLLRRLLDAWDMKTTGEPEIVDDIVAAQGVLVERAAVRDLLAQRWAILSWAVGDYSQLAERLLPVHEAGAEVLGPAVWAPATALLAACQAMLGLHGRAARLVAELEPVVRGGSLPRLASQPVAVGLNVTRQRAGQWRELLAGLQRRVDDDARRAVQEAGAWDAVAGVVHALRGDLMAARRHLASASAQSSVRDPYRVRPQVFSAWALVEALDGNAAAAREWLAHPGVEDWCQINSALMARLCRDAARLVLADADDEIADEMADRALQLLADGRASDACMVASWLARHGDDRGVQLIIDHPLAEPGPLAEATAAWAVAMRRRDPVALGRVAQQLIDLGDLGFAVEAAQESVRLSGRDRTSARGARRVLAQARAELGAVPETAGEPTTSLTPREREVAELATQRLTNAEIAARLFLSVRTVEGYLQSGFTKLGINSRSELTRFLGTDTLPPRRAANEETSATDIR